MGRLSKVYPQVDLTPIEKEAHDRWVIGHRAGLTTDQALRFYDLFLQGCSCEEISRLNPELELGAIVEARLVHNWDMEKSSYVNNMMVHIREQSQKNYMESIKFLGNVLTTVHMRFEDKLKKYFQTRDEKDLGEFADVDMKEYRHNLDLFFRLTGQDAKAVKGQININVERNGDTKVEVEEDAADFLKELNKKND